MRLRHRYGPLSDENAQYINDGGSSLTGADVIIDVLVVGSGTFSLMQIGGISTVHGSSLEFGGFVASGQVVEVAGGSKNNFGHLVQSKSTVQIDQPREFHGKVDLGDPALPIS